MTDRIRWTDQVYGRGSRESPILSFSRPDDRRRSYTSTVLKLVDWQSDFIAQIVPASTPRPVQPELVGRVVSLVSIWPKEGSTRDFIAPGQEVVWDVDRWRDAILLREVWWFVDPPLLRDVYPEEHLRHITSSARAKLGRPLPALFDALRHMEVVQVLDLHRTPKAAEWIALQDLPGGTTEILSKRRNGKGGYVYALGLDEFPGLLKIGSAFEVEARMRSLSTGLPTDLRIVASVPFPDCRVAERKIHARLPRLRPDREWFQASREDFLGAAADVQLAWH